MKPFALLPHISALALALAALTSCGKDAAPAPSPTAPPDSTVQAVAEAQQEPEIADDRVIPPYTNTLNPTAPFRFTRSNVLIVGEGSAMRAMSNFSAGRGLGYAFAQRVNRVKRALGSGVEVYCMAIPTASAFYSPDTLRRQSTGQQQAIEGLYEKLLPEVHAVNVFTPLGHHAAEPIYLRTDHHWAPLGAFYAAGRFAKVAGVPFEPLASYEQRTVRRFVGSMAVLAGEKSLKFTPEDFVYYMSKEKKNMATYIDFRLDSTKQHIVGEGKPHAGVFFATYKDGASGAYCTFMGGDAKIVTVKTGTPNGRRLLILKDSFGNALPGYLFYSFEEIHVCDVRFFPRNLPQYVREHGVTDVLLAHNVFHLANPAVLEKYDQMLSGGGE